MWAKVMTTEQVYKMARTKSEMLDLGHIKTWKMHYFGHVMWQSDGRQVFYKEFDDGYDLDLTTCHGLECQRVMCCTIPGSQLSQRDESAVT